MRLLRFQQQHTNILVEDDIPRASPTTNIRFSNFAQLFGPDDQSHEAAVWRLNAALFDEIVLKAPLPDEARSRIMIVRQKRALSDWLQQTVADAVENDLRSDSSRPSLRLFQMLAGYQIEKAVHSALETGDFNLAALLAQIGGDADFRADMEEQLVKWKDQIIDAHVDESYRKIYALLAGIVDVVPASKSKDPAERCRDLHVSHSLDWKRAFGLHLWYGTPMDGSVVDAIRSYDNAYPTLAAAPTPWYQNPAAFSGQRWFFTPRETERDALYELIKLNGDSNIQLEQALSPRSYSASPLDYRLPWHISTILTRCLQSREFSDRNSTQAASTTLSINASKLIVSFASQLEQQGFWQQAIFVLLHLDQAIEFARPLVHLYHVLTAISCSRTTSIRNMLSRNVLKISAEVETSLIEGLSIPKTWIAEAKACLASIDFLYSDALFRPFMPNTNGSRSMHICIICKHDGPS